MCRILGILNYKQFSEQSAECLIASLTDQLAHGGPDDRGIHIDNQSRVALGHRRLSIIDLSSSGRQPMPSNDNKIWITFNGEIYNYLQLKEELISLGQNFETNTDTEVILKSYIQWGIESFKKFIGMFAFCIYDKNKNKTFLVRDQSGIKPLYYSFNNDELIFSSETKTFIKFNNNWDENKDWKTYFLAYGFIPEPYTYLENVYMLAKGSYLVFDNLNSSFDIKQFDSFEFSNSESNLDEVAFNIRRLINQSVNRHLISDAPIGVFLSGGIDSSLISLCSSKFLGENLNTLSIIFDEAGYSEKKFQDIVQKQIGSKHSYFLLKEKDFLESSENIFSAMDQPTCDGINTYFISKFARESGLKTVLSGLGGDELFGGYPSFNRINKIWYLNKINKNFRQIFSAFNFLNNDKLKKVSYLSTKSPMNFYLLFRGIFNMKSICDILDLELNEVSNCIENLALQNTDLLDSKNCVSFLETDIYMKNQLLRDTDFMSMSNSVEVRVPFLDQDLVRYVLSIDPKIKYKTDMQKFLLCNSFKDIIPKEIVNRKKQGFVFPFQIWIKNNIHMFTDMINHKNAAVQKTIESFKNGNLHWSRFWSLVVLSQKSTI